MYRLDSDCVWSGKGTGSCSVWRGASCSALTPLPATSSTGYSGTRPGALPHASTLPYTRPRVGTYLLVPALGQVLPHTSPKGYLPTYLVSHTSLRAPRYFLIPVLQSQGTSLHLSQGRYLLPHASPQVGTCTSSLQSQYLIELPTCTSHTSPRFRTSSYLSSDSGSVPAPTSSQAILRVRLRLVVPTYLFMFSYAIKIASKLHNRFSQRLKNTVRLLNGRYSNWAYYVGM